MTAPTPHEFEIRVSELLSDRNAGRLRERLLKAYRWTYGDAHSRTVSEQARIRSTNPSTPTESIAAAKAHMRRALERAAEAVDGARKDLEGAARAMELALESQDPAQRPEPLRYPRTVTNAELEDSRAARTRREQRDEAIP